MSENGTDPTSKVLKFCRRLFKEAAALPESKHRVSKNILSVHSLRFAGAKFGLFYYFQILCYLYLFISVIFLLQV